MLDALLGAPFALGSRVRRARVFHPRGVVVTATWEPPADGVLPASPLTAGAANALIRISHAVGLPSGTPDIIGLAIRVCDVYGPGRHQDLLLASSGDGRVTRHLLRPAAQVTGTTYSTLLPYEVRGVGRHPLVARTVADAPPTSYAEVVANPTARMPAVTVTVDGPEAPPLATVTPTGGVDDPAWAESLRFDPWQTGTELWPVGRLNRLRRPTYPASQRGRGAA